MRRFIRRVLVVLALPPLSLGALLAVLWVEHLVPVELPRPSGPHAVGRASGVWVDSARADPLAPGEPRRLLVWAWYPAETSDTSAYAPYMPAELEEAMASYSGPFLTHFLWRRTVRAHGRAAAAPAASTTPWPVVILRSGIGAEALAYTTLAEDLASQGYVVVGSDAPRSTSVVVLPGGRVIERTTEGNPGEVPLPPEEQERLLDALLGIWTDDTAFLLDRLATPGVAGAGGLLTGVPLDLARVGVVGHSFGGATAAAFCATDARCAAGVDMDGALRGAVVGAGVPRPLLFLLSDHGDEWTSPECGICRDIRSVAAGDPDHLIVTLLRTHHFSFGDAALTQSRILRKMLAALGGPGGAPARAGLDLTTRYVRAFLDVHLRGAPRGGLYDTPLGSGARLEEH